MKPPLSTEEFLQVFARYNEAIWPMQIAVYVLGIVAVWLAAKRTPVSGRMIGLILGFYWVWMGVAYHIGKFSAINKAAYAFGVVFVVQGVLFLAFGLARAAPSFRVTAGAYGLVGGLLILYGMVVYPLMGNLLGHVYPRSPSFGVAPCPTAIFTFGLLLWADRRVPGYLLVIPLLWSLIGFSAAVHLGMREDILLPVAGVVATLMAVARNRRERACSSSG